jgi:hypothetical protein
MTLADHGLATFTRPLKLTTPLKERKMAILLVSLVLQPMPYLFA